jgi:Uncharacterized conserved protein
MMEKTLEELGRRSIKTRGEGVHNARKQLKQLRSMLRLMRYGLSNKTYKRQNRVFRDAGRPLSEVRDADVMIETLDKLIEHYADQVQSNSFRKLRRALLERRKTIRKDLVGKQRVMGKVSRSLREEIPRIKKWTSTKDDHRILLRGIQSTYAQAKKEMKIAIEENSDESFHQLRKSVKYLRYQLETLESIWPPVVCLMVDQTHQLADLLGLDHDLAVLESLVADECAKSCEPEEKELLHALVRQRKMELRKEAIVIGDKFFAETPKQFLKRLNAYWKSWQNKPQGPVAA